MGSGLLIAGSVLVYDALVFLSPARLSSKPVYRADTRELWVGLPALVVGGALVYWSDRLSGGHAAHALRVTLTSAGCSILGCASFLAFIGFEMIAPLPLTQNQPYPNMKKRFAPIEWRTIRDRYLEFPLRHLPRFDVTIEKQKWRGLKAGTKVWSSKGESSIRGDLAGIELSLRILNPSAGTLQFPPLLVILGSKDEGITKVTPKAAENDADPGREELLEIGPGETRTIQLESSYTGVEEYRRGGKLGLWHPVLYWRLELPPLPNDSVLFDSK